MLTLRVKEICKEKGMTLNALAEKIGISQPSISGIATGKQKPSLDTIERIADALDIPVSLLFERKGDFIAFVRRNGETFTFESEGALKEYAATLPLEEKK